MHAKEVGADATAAVRRIGVFVDYWYAYTSARQLFAQPGVPPPAWFGNVSPRALAGAVVKRPPVGTRRSERELSGLHIFVRHFDPEVHRSQLERVRRWELEGAGVVVGPSREQGGGHWQSSVNVALAAAVVDALGRGRYDTAVVFAGDGALWPMFAAVSGEVTPSESVELATWIAPDGTVPTALTEFPRVWCHRLGEATFKNVVDDRRPAHHPPKPRPDWRAGHSKATQGPPSTAMAAAMAAAGLRPDDLQAPKTVPAPAESPAPAAADEAPHGVRRITQRFFNRGA
jgi:hypothetical protein